MNQYQCLRCKGVFDSRDPEPFCGPCNTAIITGRKKTPITKRRSSRNKREDRDG